MIGVDLADLGVVRADEFEAQLECCKREAFRLELLQIFRVGLELDAIQRYSKGQIDPPLDYNKDWRSLVASNCARGVKHLRVRLACKPYSDYLLFETAWGYRLNIEAGEEVSLIDAKSYETFKACVPVFQDFWLLDEKLVFLMTYDLLGHFLGVHSLPSKAVEPYILLKQEALQRGKDIRSTTLWKTAIGQ